MRPGELTGGWMSWMRCREDDVGWALERLGPWRVRRRPQRIPIAEQNLSQPRVDAPAFSGYAGENWIIPSPPFEFGRG